MLQSIEVKNFKNIRNQKIAFDPLTVIVGANAAGKTTLLEAIHLAIRAATGDPKKVFGCERHCDWMYTRGSTGLMSLSCQSKAGTFCVAADPPQDYPFDKIEDFGRGVWGFEKEPQDLDELNNAIGDTRGCVFLHLQASNLAKPSYSDRRPPRVEYDGTGLASVLSYMLLTDRDAFDELEDRLRSFIPGLKRINIRKEHVYRSEEEVVRFGDDAVTRRKRQKYEGEALLLDFDNAKGISSHGLSEGTLMLLGLLTVLYGPTQPSLLLLDDIDHGLHPRAQQHLISLLGDVVAAHNGLQIIASTHSPFILDGVQANQVRVVTSDNEGYSLFGKMTDHPEFGHWKDEMTPGEYWTMIGEKWIGKPASDDPWTDAIGTACHD